MTSITTDKRIDATEDLVKYSSGQYDCELVRTLTLAHLSLRSLGGALRNCSTLTVLDISDNALPSLDGVEATSGTLRRLNASSNHLTSSSGILSCCVQLEVLDLSGNRIEDAAPLLGELAVLPLLRSLHLQGYQGDQANPCCKAIGKGYGAMITTKLPKLRCLDGHYFCHEDLNPQRIDHGDDDEFQLPPTQPWITEGYFNTKGFDYGKRVGAAAEQQFNHALVECKKTLERPVNNVAPPPTATAS
jgi:hypothetical protein